MPHGVRRAAGALRVHILGNPDRALQHLEELAERIAPSLPVGDPEQDMAKCVGIENYWAFYLDEDIGMFFDDSETYRREVEAESDPAKRLVGDLRVKEPLIARKYSWMVDGSDIEGLSGSELKVALELRYGPPYAVLLLPKVAMQRSGVQVRKPRALDAVPARLTEWRASGLASGVHEWIDADIPLAALGGIAWRP